MVYTVTFNPSLDYVVNLNEFEAGSVNRSIKEKIFPGGKGINVSIVLKNLGIDNTALGFAAGFTGEEIVKRINEFGCKTDFIKLEDGFSRINVKLKAEKESEINGCGPEISNEKLEELYEKLDSLSKGDILVLAGSIPGSLSDKIYMDILKRLENRKIKVVVDTTGKSLINVLKYKPFLIKPNNYEMSEIFEKNIESEEDLIKYGKKLIELGAENVLISRAENGAKKNRKNGEVIVNKAPQGRAVNSVGAGDSMVAGFIAGFIEKEDFDYALKMGIAAGSASAFSEELATKDEVEAVLWRSTQEKVF